MSVLGHRPGLSARALLRWQFRLAHDLLEATLERLPAEAVHRLPPGTAAPVGACYAQIVLCEDLSVNGALAAGVPLALSTWVGRTGLSELPPLAGSTDWRAWARRVRLDLARLRPYARAVYASTDAYLAALPDDALDLARGERPACLLSALLLTLSTRRGGDRLPPGPREPLSRRTAQFRPGPRSLSASAPGPSANRIGRRQ